MHWPYVPVMLAINGEEMMCSSEVIPVYTSVAESRTWQGLLLAKFSWETISKVLCLKLVDIQRDFTAWYFWTCSKKRMTQTRSFADEKSSQVANVCVTGCYMYVIL